MLPRTVLLQEKDYLDKGREMFLLADMSQQLQHYEKMFKPMFSLLFMFSWVFFKENLNIQIERHPQF